MSAIDRLPFKNVWLYDSEFVARPGERQDVVCLAARELRSNKRIALLRSELGASPPYDIGPDSVFVSFVANAECSTHLALRWQLPKNNLDLSPMFRRIVAGRAVPEGYGLIGALRYYGLSAHDARYKDTMCDRIMRGPPYTSQELSDFLVYCAKDADVMEELLERMLNEPDFDLGVALLHGEFAAVSAVMEHSGVPIDKPLYDEMTETETWRRIRDEMVPTLDAPYGVYTRNPDGDWVFNKNNFEEYLTRESIIASWPRTDTGELVTKQKVLDELCKSFPQLESLRQLRHIRSKMRKVKLAVGHDGRNRTVLWPFKSKTSRTQPKAAQWIFSPAVWMRSLIKPGPGMAVAYVDYSAMEFLLAAALSGDEVMLEMYRSGDPYLSFAKRVGAVPPDATKNDPRYAPIREKYKTMLLAVQYGMSVYTLAARLNVSLLEAEEMLFEHRTTFSTYWKWSNDWVAAAFRDGVMRTHFGWRCEVGELELNERTIRNWPIQSAGADILRAACIMAHRHGLRIVAPVHDAILIEAPIEQIDAHVALLQEIMRRASRVVLNSAGSIKPIELRAEANVVRYPDRYSDKRGIKIWNNVMDLLDHDDAAIVDPKDGKRPTKTKNPEPQVQVHKLKVA